MSKEVLTVSPHTLEEIKKYYTTVLKTTTPLGELFAAKKNG